MGLIKPSKSMIFSVCGLKNSGKTTLIQKFIPIFRKRGMKVAVIKHDGHDFMCDIPETDSYRYMESGAVGTAVFSDNRVFMHKLRKNVDAAVLTDLFPEAQVIVIEGLKDSRLPKIEIVRSDISDNPVSNPEGRFLIVSDLPAELFNEPVLGFSDDEKIVDLIIQKIQNESKTQGDYMGKLTHFDENGKAVMVDVTDKSESQRTATATGRITVNQEVYDAIEEGTIKKGDVLGVAATAGIMGAKKTSELIPMCHILPLTSCRIMFDKVPEERSIYVYCTVKCTGRTGVEMEALTGASAALLTIYDMCKALDKKMEIGEIFLLKKDGGKSGRIENTPVHQPPFEI